MIGAIAVCRQTGNQAWVIRGPAGEGSHYHLLGKERDAKGRENIVSRTAGAGDVVVVEEPPQFTPGDIVERFGKRFTVLSDDGDEVTLITPDETVTTRRGGINVRSPGGNTCTVSKAAIAIENL